LLIYASMMRADEPSRRLLLSKEERSVLEKMALGAHVPARLVCRARLILARERGESNHQIARELRVSPATVRKWCSRFATLRLGGLVDKPRRGAPRLIDDAVVEAVVKWTLAERSNQARNCTSRRLARALGVSQSAVMRIWRDFGLSRSSK
jgi:transposase